MLAGVILGCIILVISCVLLWKLWVWTKQEQRLVITRKHVNNLVGEEVTSVSKALKKAVEDVPVKDRTAEESYDLFIINYWHEKDEKASQKTAKEVLAKITIRSEPADDWIADRMRRALVDPKSRDILNSREKKVAQKQKAKKEPKGAKNIDKKKMWKSDSQNVHDSTINQELKKQFQIIVQENKKGGGDHDAGYRRMGRTKSSRLEDIDHAFNEAREWMLRTSKKDLSNVLDRLSQGSLAIILGPGVTEKQVLAELWMRSTLGSNSKRTKNLREALKQAVSDCCEKGKMVCSTGRVSRLMSSLAFVDCNPRMGKVRSKEMFQNEFLEKCANIVRVHRSSLGKNLQNAYDRGEPIAEPVVQKMQDAMDVLSKKYRGKFDSTRLDRLLQECKDSA